VSWRALVPARFGGCPAAWELSRALAEDGHVDVAVHVSGCGRCAAAWSDLARTSAAARELPSPRMDEETRHRIEAGLLGEASLIAQASGLVPDPRAWWRRATAILATCGIAAAALVVTSSRLRGHRESSSGVLASLASIRAVGAATFSRLQPPPDEIVRLDAGILEIEVGAPLGGRRFRIATDDAVIEAAEGRFSVEAETRTLVAVRVFAGYAEVRAHGGHAGLHAGDEWARVASHAERRLEEPVASPRPTGAVPRSPSASQHAPARAPSRAIDLAPGDPIPSQPPRASSASAPRRASFERGWRLLRSGEPARAAEAFGEVDAQSGGDAISEDASFWQAVALARAKMPDEARVTLLHFVSRFPGSERIGEASAMLGWMLLESGDAEGARRAFERAKNDRVDRVRTSARSGLERLDRSTGAGREGGGPP
jgi:hypothetical protein